MAFSFSPPSIPLARPAVVVAAYRYDPAYSPPFIYLPNVLCLAVQYREGPEPPTARFRYAFDQLAGDGRPLHFEQVFPLFSAGRYVVQNDDRLIVLYHLPDGSSGILFDGFASVPQVDVDPDGQQVTFLAYSVAVRELDRPVGGGAYGAIYRRSDTPDDPEANVATDLPIRFNPDGRGNASPADHDSTGSPEGGDPFTYPVFMDEDTADPDHPPRYWTLDMAFRYLVAAGHTNDPAWTKWPAVSAWDDYLKAWEPASLEDGELALFFFDPADPTTYNKTDILVPDVDISGMPWPMALARLIEPHGMGIVWKLGYEPGGEGEHDTPVTYLDLFRRDAPVNVKALYFQPAGQPLDPALTNVGSMSLSRDVAGLATEVGVLTGPTRYEVSLVLAPGFAIAAADASDANLPKWERGSTAGGADSVKYRRFIFAEDGAPYWDFALAALVEGNATSLASILADPDDPVAPEDQYVRRPRPPIGELISIDPAGNRLRAELWISTDYDAEEDPDGGTWQKVSGGWKLLDDRIGVQLTMDEPDNWNVGKSTDANAPYGKQGKVRVVKSLASPDAANPRFYLRLTCVIEGDRDLRVVAEDRGVGPSAFTIRRTVDCRDKFWREVIHASSHLNSEDENVVARDDTDAARAYAFAQQRQTELARFAGSVTIPRLTLAYSVGDKVAGVAGRNMSLQSNVGGSEGEGPVFPTVVGLDFMFEGGQQTIIHLSDERSRPDYVLPRGRGRRGRRR